MYPALVLLALVLLAHFSSTHGDSDGMWVNGGNAWSQSGCCFCDGEQLMRVSPLHTSDEMI